MEILSLIIIALLVESVWETLKMVWQNNKICIDRVGALVIGILVCFSANISLFSFVGININPIIGLALTGILISRGSSFIHELLSKMEKK